MAIARYDAAVIGAGPAGSATALVLARGGARVALVDKARFPREKACGDLVGPRGVRLLGEFGVVLDGRAVGDMEVCGPRGGRVLLRASAGERYPGHALAIRRVVLDAAVRAAALEAGAEEWTGRAGDPLLGRRDELEGFALGGGRAVRADVVIGADGALSHVGAVAGLVADARVLWAFALRGYSAPSPALPEIAFLETRRLVGYPGYAWCFPGPDESANVGIGAAARGERRFAAAVPAALDAYASRRGHPVLRDRLGGWLKLGGIGTTPAVGRTLLVGDAAGLVNPLQGEGIAAALGSGVAAAEAVLAGGVSGAADHYRRALNARHGAYFAASAPLTAALLGRARTAALVARLATAPGLGAALAGGWALYWNDLIAGAPPGVRRAEARTLALAARLLSYPSSDQRQIWEALGGAPQHWPWSAVRRET